MLIRHISIPRHSHLISLQQPKQKQVIEDSRDYSTYLNRTLNPQSPDSDVLISHRQEANNKQHQTNSDFNRHVPEVQQMLTSEEPLQIEQFTDISVSPGKQTYNPDYSRQRERKYSKLMKIKQKLPTFSSLTPQLNNQAYIRQFDSQRVNLIAPIVNNPYISQKGEMKKEGELKKDEQIVKKDENEQDRGIVNNHTKSSIKNGDVYRTLQQFRSKKLMNEVNQQQRLANHKKYNFSLPKHNFASKHTQSVNQNVYNADTPIKAARKQSIFQKQKNQGSTYTINQRKKKMVPYQQQDAGNPDGLLFKNYRSKYNKFRKTSQQENVINGKPQSQIVLSSKHNKIKRNSAFELTPPALPKIQISYRVSISELKQICSLKQLEKKDLMMKIPQIFTYPLFTEVEDQQSLFTKAEQLLKHLRIKDKSEISIKKYTNCILIICNNTAVVWNFSGKVYLGGWRFETLEDGCRHGIGLEWSPKKYIYIGEFARNKREGVGIMKNSAGQTLAGLWRQSKFVRSLSLNLDLKAGRGMGEQFGRRMY